ncbi:MAG: hypothetical protein GXP63_00860 [DPANN group archaeon]|nr:hypothetical protein [DPANN group archaeon]
MGIKLNILSPDEKLLLKYKGIFDLDEMLEMAQEWYHQRGFHFHEHKFKAQDLQQGGEAYFYWTGFRNDTEFLRVWVHLYFHFWDLEQVDVVKDKKKKTMMRGRMKVQFQGFIEIDYKNKYETSKFMETLREFYWKTIYLKRIQVYGDKIEYELHGFHEKFKQLLSMHNKGDQFQDMW